MKVTFHCEACNFVTGEPICRRPATHWHHVEPGDPDPQAICAKHACKRCKPMSETPCASVAGKP